MPSDLPPYEKFVSEIAPSQQSCKVCIYAKLVSDIATTVLSNIMRVCAKRKLVSDIATPDPCEFALCANS